ncbi:MAG: peptide/nickel transport system ATP-binding protein [Lysobacterales bacterium]
MSTPVLKVRNLNIAFRGMNGLEAVVDGISFDLFAGEIVGLVGESGCGKSVTARALMGLLPAHTTKTSSVSMQLAGKELSGLDSRGWRQIRGRDMAMIFQEPSTALDPVFTLGQQINGVLRRHQNISRSDAKLKTISALEMGGFTDAMQVYHAYPHQLSGGMRQLAMIALAMATRPRILIADEPTTALDVTTQTLVLEQLKHLRDEYATAVLLVTHDLGVVAQSCSRAMVMYCGRLVEQSEYTEMFHHPRHPYTKGLLEAVPRIHSGSGNYAKAIPGRVPSYKEYPPGCHFAERCSRADDLCLKKYPPIEYQNNSRVACHHPLGSK